ncbi:hypothetical protein [Aureispira anguillae]|nr:hypothetical protein [Aureispira anguillae]
MIILFFLGASPILGQRSIYEEDIKLIVRTTGRLLTPHKLLMVVDVEIPEGWKLKVENGYESMLQDGIDTVDMALKFSPKPSYTIVQRLKADRKPSSKGYYYKKVRFVQTMRIDTAQLPINIDAELRLSAVRLDEKDFAKGLPCCLLQVCKKRKDVKTIKVGWDCDRREKVYLEDVLK